MGAQRIIGKSGIVAEVNAAGQLAVSSAPAATGTSTLANVAAATSSTTLLAANAARLGATIWNDSTSVLYVKKGSTASATSCNVKLVADAYYEVPFNYTGIITGVWVAANGAARVSEDTA